MFAYAYYICCTMLNCILYHHIISKFYSFLDQILEALKKINANSESKEKVILNHGQKNTCQQCMYESFNGPSIMEPQLIVCCFFVLGHDQPFKGNTLKNIYIWLLFQDSGSDFWSTFILKQQIDSPCILLSIKYYWKNIAAAWEVYIIIWFQWNVKLEKTMYIDRET